MCRVFDVPSGATSSKNSSYFLFKLIVGLGIDATDLTLNLFLNFLFFCLTVKVRLYTLELEAFELRRNTHPRAKQFFKKTA